MKDATRFMQLRDRLQTALLLGALLLCPVALTTAQVANPEDVVSISTTWSAGAVKPGEQIVLAVVINVSDGYHIGSSADQMASTKKGQVMPTEVRLSSPGLASGVATVEESSFPSIAADNPAQRDASHLVGETIVYVPVKISPLVPPQTLDLELVATYQACNESLCFTPQTVKRKLTLEIAKPDSLGQGCPDPKLFARWSDRRSQKLSSKAEGVDYKSKEPPIGPPWVRDLALAQRLALKSGRPIFLYSTKTFCPHCVIVESEMLSSPDLKPYYDQAVWLYVYRDFQGGEADRKAERIGIRYSLSSWPQLWLIDPHDLTTITEIGRTVAAFAEATAEVKIESTDDLSAIKVLARQEAAVNAFDRNPTSTDAKRLLESEDVVAQLLAVRFLLQEGQEEQITSRSNRLLSIPNDALRYEVLKTIANTGASNATEVVSRLVRDPQPSRNFNVLRSYAIQALGSCGDETAIDVIAPHAKGTARNMTTSAAIEAMAKIAARHPDCQPLVIEKLAESFPPVEASVARLVQTRALQVHKHLQNLSGREIAFPESYTDLSRDNLIKAWTSGE